jgi:hypothetical protein
MSPGKHNNSSTMRSHLGSVRPFLGIGVPNTTENIRLGKTISNFKGAYSGIQLPSVKMKGLLGSFPQKKSIS